MTVKKVYVEITNNCNLDCQFCIKNVRPNKFMSLEEFEVILKKLQNYTEYLYFHVLGEPLLHPNINEFIDLARKYHYQVNITTNGYLINRLKNKEVRQINVSLHSFDARYNISITNYMNNILDRMDMMENTYFSLRFWVKSKYMIEMLNIINKRYNTKIGEKELKEKRNIRINNHIFINIASEFRWPDLNNSFTVDEGKCYALRDHFAILVDGTVVPCCLDAKGIIKLGNIFQEDMAELIKSRRWQHMLDGFKNKKKYETLCQKCRFLEP